MNKHILLNGLRLQHSYFSFHTNIFRMRIALFFLVSLLFFSCKESPETKFEKDGISFTCPAGWKITDQEGFDEQGYYLAIQKDGINASGFISVTWVNGEIDLEEWMNIYKDELSNNFIYKNSNVSFGEPYPETFQDTDCLALDFTATILGMKHEGLIRVFYTEDKTVAILNQQAEEDKEKNEPGFEAFENSFRAVYITPEAAGEANP